jgi:hypothetical protein
MNGVCLLALSGVCLSVAGFPQFGQASVVGVVKDPSGLPMPQVAIEIRSVATNISRGTVTSATGD